MELMIEEYRRTLVFIVGALLCSAMLTQSTAAEQTPLRLAFLGVRLQNDNKGFEPTTDAERNRIARIEKQFTSAVGASGVYSIVPLTDEVRSKIAKFRERVQSGPGGVDCRSESLQSDPQYESLYR
jgi:hypothetical protein